MANHADFTELRRQIDHAITFHDVRAARDHARKGFARAQAEEIISEQMYFRGQFEIINGHFEKAIPYLDKAIEYNPTDGAAFNDRALCMVELGIIEGVMEYFDRGIAVEPDYATIYHNKAWFLNKLGQHQESLVLFKRTWRTCMKISGSSPMRSVPIPKRSSSLNQRSAI